MENLNVYTVQWNVCYIYCKSRDVNFADDYIKSRLLVDLFSRNFCYHGLYFTWDLIFPDS